MWALIDWGPSFYPLISDELLDEATTWQMVRAAWPGRFPWEFDPSLDYGAIYWTHRTLLFEDALRRVDKERAAEAAREAAKAAKEPR